MKTIIFIGLSLFISGCGVNGPPIAKPGDFTQGIYPPEGNSTIKKSSKVQKDQKKKTLLKNQSIIIVNKK